MARSCAAAGKKAGLRFANGSYDLIREAWIILPCQPRHFETRLVDCRQASWGQLAALPQEILRVLLDLQTLATDFGLVPLADGVLPPLAVNRAVVIAGVESLARLSH